MNEAWLDNSPHITRTPDGIARPLGLIPSKLYGLGILPTVPGISDNLIPVADLVAFDSWPSALRILDQGQWNACTYFASAQALMFARHESGQPHVQLDPMWPYLVTTGGRNTGTNILQASQVLSASGMPPLGSTQSTGVTAQALRFRSQISQSLGTWQELLSEVARRRPVVGSVFVGRNYHQLDSEGAMGADRGMANHAIFLGGGLKHSKVHGWMIKHAGSWGAAWGQNGFGWYTERLFDYAAYGEAYTVEAVREDLADSENPPQVLDA